MRLVLTCEHAGNLIPGKYQAFFTGTEEILNSHRGYDPGAHDLFVFLRKLADYNKEHRFSRLLVEINRSLGHPHLFSEITGKLSASEKEKILESFYHPYRKEVEKKIKEYISKDEQVLHLSIHSFTPILNGDKRNADIGLLYDPERIEEKLFCRTFKQRLLQEDQGLKVRFNYPYLGKADGFTTYLRRKFPKNYLGIEVEVNQKFETQGKFPSHLKTVLRNTLAEVKKHMQKDF